MFRELAAGLLLVFFAFPLISNAATVAELQAQIQSLMVQVATLKTQQGTAAAPSAGGAASCPNLTRNLSLGLRGSDIAQLQQFLISQNLLTAGNASGYFGLLTQAAVKKFQCMHQSLVCGGTPASTGYGAVGPKTRNIIAMSCKGRSSAIPDIKSNPVQTMPPAYGGAGGSVGGGGSTSGGGGGGNSGGGGESNNATCSWNGQNIAHSSSITTYQASSVPSGSQCVSQTSTCTNGVLSGSYAFSSCTIGPTPSCTFNGQTVANGQSITAYQATTAPYGSQCVSESRACNNGMLSGSYGNASCSVQQPVTVAGYDASPLPSSSNRQTLAAAFPNVKAVALYWFFANGEDYARDLQLTKLEIPKMKAAGFNAVEWSIPWRAIEPNPFSTGSDKWSAAGIDALMQHMKLFKDSGMKVITYVNYLGDGWAPQGIMPGTWCADPKQYQAYIDYQNTLARLLRDYNDNIIYMTITEGICLRVYDNSRYVVKGYDNLTGQFFTETPELAQRRKQALIDTSDLYRSSIGRVPLDVAPDVRANVWLGFHDNLLLGDNSLYKDFGMKKSPVQANPDGTAPFDVLSIDAQFNDIPGGVQYILDIQDYSKSHSAQQTHDYEYQYLQGRMNATMAGAKIYFPTARTMLSEAWSFPDIDFRAYPGPMFYKNLTDPLRETFVESIMDWSSQTNIPVFLWGWIPRYYDSYDRSQLEEGIALTDRLGNFSSALKVLCNKVFGVSFCSGSNPYYSQYGVEQKHQLRSGSVSGTTVTCDWGGNTYCGKASVGKGGQAITSTIACTWTGWVQGSTAATYSCPALQSGDVVFCEMFDYSPDTMCQAQNSKVPVYIKP